LNSFWRHQVLEMLIVYFKSGTDAGRSLKNQFINCKVV
jgi:hypothetical protein